MVVFQKKSDFQGEETLKPVANQTPKKEGTNGPEGEAERGIGWNKWVTGWSGVDSRGGQDLRGGNGRRESGKKKAANICRGGTGRWGGVGQTQENT